MKAYEVMRVRETPLFEPCQQLQCAQLILSAKAALQFVESVKKAFERFRRHGLFNENK